MNFDELTLAIDIYVFCIGDDKNFLADIFFFKRVKFRVKTDVAIFPHSATSIVFNFIGHRRKRLKFLSLNV